MYLADIIFCTLEVKQPILLIDASKAGSKKSFKQDQKQIKG
jgi:hypothetical protein